MNNKPTIKINENCSWDGLNIEIQFRKPVPKENKPKIEKVIKEWADKGIDQGYGGGYIHNYGEIEWDDKGSWVTVWMDMGHAGDSAIDELAKAFSLFPFTKAIKVGYEHPTPLGFLKDKKLIKEVEKTLREIGQK